jgi:hypothetical protein
MTPAQGQTVRRVGMLIQVLSLYGLFSLGKGKFDLWRNSDLDPSIVLTAGFGTGFCLWLAGTVAIHWERFRKKGEPRSH